MEKQQMIKSRNTKVDYKKIEECFDKIPEIRPSNHCLMPENKEDFVESSMSNDLIN